MNHDTLPQHLAAEKSVLGAVLLHPKCLAEVGDLVTSPEDFAHPAHKAIWEAIRALDEAGKPIDSLTVADEMRGLETLDKLRAVQGEDYFAELQTQVISVENVRHHAEVVQRKAYRRRLALGLSELLGRCVGQSESDEDFLLAFQERVLAMLDDRGETGGLRRMKQVLGEVFRALDDKWQRKQAGESVALPGVTTGLRFFDYLLGGWQDGKLYTVAGRPGMGKTAFVMTSAEKAASPPHLATWAIFSKEMLDTELAQRVLSSHARVDGKRIERVELDSGDWLRLSRAAGEVSQMPIYLDSSKRLDFNDVRQRSRRLRHQIGPEARMVVVIDYLQLLDPALGDDDRTREREVAYMSGGCKDMARELRCPVIALSQLNRSLEARPDKRPRLSDLRESGAIEQDSDVVIFLYRDEVYSKKECKPEDQGVCEVDVAKHRGGDLGMDRVAFIKHYTRFEELSDRGTDGGRPHYSDQGDR